VAHFAKGGIFFWLGIVMIARWAGAFADLGWAWNVKPPTAGRAPSMELVESALICFYGVSNVWLEHLNAWGAAWSAMDLEHVAITVLFFGGGLVSLSVSFGAYFPLFFEEEKKPKISANSCSQK
jgi:hypothetical protein